MAGLEHYIINNLSPDLLKPKYRGNKNKLYGHCYVASEVYYHLKGKELGYKPHYIKVNGDTHWFLKKGEDIVDITRDQFGFEINYDSAVSSGFLTKHPSKRAKILINKIMDDKTKNDIDVLVNVLVDLEKDFPNDFDFGGKARILVQKIRKLKKK